MGNDTELRELRKFVMGLKKAPLKEFGPRKNGTGQTMTVEFSTWIPEGGFPDGGFYVDARAKVYSGTARPIGPASEDPNDSESIEVLSSSAYFYDGEEIPKNKVFIEDFDPSKYEKDLMAAAFEEADSRD